MLASRRPLPRSHRGLPLLLEDFLTRNVRDSSTLAAAPLVRASRLAIDVGCLGQVMACLALRLAGVLTREPLAANVVDPVRHGFEVTRIPAGPNSAQVIQDQTVRDGPDQLFVADAVHIGRALGAFRGVTDRGLPVAAGVGSPLPHPARPISCDANGCRCFDGSLLEALKKREPLAEFHVFSWWGPPLPVTGGQGRPSG